MQAPSHDQQCPNASGRGVSASTRAPEPDPGRRPRPGLLTITGARTPRIPPPLYYGAALAGGLALQNLWPLGVPPVPAWTAVGVTLLASGLSLNFGALTAVFRNRTTLVPHHHVRTLISGGAYRLSRNPMYTGLALAVAGAALVLGTWWPALLLGPAVLVVRRLVIEPEERYLHDRFGPAYDAYCRHVPRWL